ncbi:MAG: DUF1016 family protein [Cytophagaceae bacterium]|nr:DUF1016 family protein [Cytophagaceae bacterium]
MLIFENLVQSIVSTNEHFRQSAIKAVNINHTVRNWLIGYYIAEYEQNGEDRAAYGESLIDKLALRISQKGLSSRNLNLFRQFYFSYKALKHSIFELLKGSTIVQLLPAQSPFIDSQIVQSLPAQLQNTDNEELKISQSTNDELGNIHAGFQIKLLERVSFTHFTELIKIEDATKRRFYEILIIKTTPSIRELKRQISTLAFERTGLSKNTDLAFDEISRLIEPEKPTEAIKNIYFFDFLGLRNDALIEEADLEKALIDHVQTFILELGNGFCFEQRQKRILIDNEYYFADLVFYHRILKCHVIVELKVDAFKHEHLSQLNTYVAYYNAEVKRTDDNPAVGILLCTEKGKKLVEYATAGMDNQLFVSKYLLQLPSKEDIEAFLLKEIDQLK